jgi:tetratricopeptide (TPR) repeat protein
MAHGRWPLARRQQGARGRHTPRVVVLACAFALAAAPLAYPQSSAPLAQRPELTRLDALLAAGDTAASEALLQKLEPELAKSDRLAFDTIYVLIGRGRYTEARAQWNRLGARVQESLRTARPAPSTSAPSAATAASPAKPGEGPAQRLLAEALFTQGLLIARGGDAKEAMQSLQQADGLGFPPLDSPLMLLVAECLLELGEFGPATSAYREYVKRRPSNMTARAGLGAALYSGGKLHEAQKELEAVLAAAPTTPRANYTLGAVLFELKLYDEARTHLERELALDARCTLCLSRLAHLAYLDADDLKCEALLAKALALDPADLEAELVSGMLALRAGKYDAAIERLSRVVERSPEYPAARFQLATAYRRAGNAEKAREQFDAYKRLLDAQKARELVRGSV